MIPRAVGGGVDWLAVGLILWCLVAAGLGAALAAVLARLSGNGRRPAGRPAGAASVPEHTTPAAVKAAA